MRSQYTLYLSVMNMPIKYADDTILLVPCDSDVDLAQEFN